MLWVSTIKKKIKVTLNTEIIIIFYNYNSKTFLAIQKLHSSKPKDVYAGQFIKTIYSSSFFWNGKFIKVIPLTREHFN